MNHTKRNRGEDGMNGLHFPVIHPILAAVLTELAERESLMGIGKPSRIKRLKLV